jgi:hypothetical protein
MNEIQDNSHIGGFPGSLVCACLVSNLGIKVLTQAGPGCDTSTGFPISTAMGKPVGAARNDTPCAVSAIAELALRIRHGIFCAWANLVSGFRELQLANASGSKGLDDSAIALW